MSLHANSNIQPDRLSLDRVPDGGLVKIEALRFAAQSSVVRLGVDPVVVTGHEARRLRDGLRGSIIEAGLAYAPTEGLMGVAPSEEAARALRIADLPSHLALIIESWNADLISVHFRTRREPGHNSTQAPRGIDS